ncbi:MAG: hypothetical protein AB7L09_03305 [Nitrospira sp.]
MGNEQFANGRVVYTSEHDTNRSCVESLRDDAHYRFTCRCGCGAQFAGYGKDIKAAARIGGTFDPKPVMETTGTVVTSTGLTVTTPPRSSCDQTCSNWEVEDQPDPKGEEVTNVAPFVSDRYLKKAQFGLTDAEIEADAAERGDPLESLGFKLSMRQPPAIADQVYSLATGEGPMTLLEYKYQKINVDENPHRILCGICRTSRGNYVSIPLADLALSARPTRPRIGRPHWSILFLMMVLSATVGSAVVHSLWQML